MTSRKRWPTSPTPMSRSTPIKLRRVAGRARASNFRVSRPRCLPRLENIHTLSSIIADRRDQLGSLLKTTETVSNTLRTPAANIGNLIRQGKSLVGEFVMRRDRFESMMQALTDLVQTLSGIVIDDRPELEKLLTESA